MRQRHTDPNHIKPKYTSIIISSIFSLIGLPILAVGIYFAGFTYLHHDEMLAGWEIVILPLFLGGVFTFVGLANLNMALKQYSRKKKAQSKGKHIRAIVEYVSVDSSLIVNGDSPFVIHCSYEDPYTRETYDFQSEQFWDDPEEVFPLGSEIDVLVDPDDYSNYHVDAEAKMKMRYQK